MGAPAPLLRPWLTSVILFFGSRACSASPLSSPTASSPSSSSPPYTKASVTPNSSGGKGSSIRFVGAGIDCADDEDDDDEGVGIAISTATCTRGRFRLDLPSSSAFSGAFSFISITALLLFLCNEDPSVESLEERLKILHGESLEAACAYSALGPVDALVRVGVAGPEVDDVDVRDVGGVVYVTENGLMSSQSAGSIAALELLPAPPCKGCDPPDPPDSGSPAPAPRSRAIHASHILGFLDKSTRGRADVGGIHVPFLIASSIIRLCRRLKRSDRTTIADETARSKTSVAKKVYKYRDAEVAIPWFGGPWPPLV